MSEVNRVLESYKKHHRLANYMSAAMLYLKDNYFLEEELKQEHIKKRVLGHWGTVPGLNFIYGGLNHVVKKFHAEVMFIAGPGHGAPAILANQFIEGTLGEFYPKYKVNRRGFENLLHDFSWPGGFPSHTTPMVPGSIHEGGELGYSLATAFGTVFDNPHLTTVCVIGDGEAETGTLAASWHGNKFLNPTRDGVVLPILHLNGYRISGPTIFGTMSDGEIMSYFRGLGYEVMIVDQYKSEDIYNDYLQSLLKAFNKIAQVKMKWSEYGMTKPEWPLIVLRTKKGWTGPVEFKGELIEDNNLSHGIPLKNPAKDQDEFEELRKWLKSYEVHSLISSAGEIDTEIKNFLPDDEHKIGRNRHSFGGAFKKKLILPNLEDHELKNFERGERGESRMEQLAQYIRDIFDLNTENRNFRFFSPDESESNLLETPFVETDRAYMWPVRKQDKFLSPSGRIVELLSENVLHSMMQGYVATGRYGILISYEAFLNIVTSQIDQYIKFLRQYKEHSFYRPLPSMNFVATSTLWRQEHNGFSHQNPTLINSLITKHSDFVSVYFPCDVNTLLVTAEKVFTDENKLNLIVACKRETPQWLYLDEAKEHVEKGISIWEWTDKGNETQNPQPTTYDLILASAGDYQTVEMMKCHDLLTEILPELSIRIVNVNEISPLGLGSINNPIDDLKKFEHYFGKDTPIVFNFHGYPEVIKQLTWQFNVADRMRILGYIEKGTTTTPFDMQVKNGTDRFSMAIEAVKLLSKFNSIVNSKKDTIIGYIQENLDKHHQFILEKSEDLY